MIDWKVAERTATTLVRPGPDLSAEAATQVVESLRAAAAKAEAPVSEYTGLRAPDVPASQAPVLVVDRARWIEANLATFSQLLDPLLTKFAEQNQLSRSVRRVGSVVGGVEIATLLSYLSSKVLGQFDPLWTAAAGQGGRLLLVAPNIVAVEQRLGVDPEDFRLWVALHEHTHRLQFTAVPWMRGHLRDLMDELVAATDLDSRALSRLFSEDGKELVRLLRGDSEASLADFLQNDQQKAAVDRITGVMSLLEGHADVVMDGVGPEVIGTVKQIRKKFEQRRSGGSGLDQLLRRLLGMESKLRQYREGAVFVREVVDTVGRDGFDAVWAEPANLPTRAEIQAPATWISRVKP